MFNARQLMIFYFYGTCNQKATIIQFQKLKEKAKTDQAENDHLVSNRAQERMIRKMAERRPGMAKMVKVLIIAPYLNKYLYLFI